MKKLFIIILLYLMQSSAFAETAIIGSGIKQEGTVLLEADDITEINFNVPFGDTDFSTANTWQTQVGEVTGIWGVHLHTVGVTSCQVIDRNGSTIRIDDCINHRKGEEFEAFSSEFPNLTSLTPPYSSTFVSISSTTVILSDTFTTDEQLKTRIPLGRVQEAATGGYTIIDLRPIVSEKDRLDYTFRRELFGPAVGIDGGLIASEVTGVPRTLSITSGKFGDERGQVHTLPAFNSLTGLTIWTTTPGPFPNITAVHGLLTIDNINYNDRITGGLTPAQNNNKWIYMDFVVSPSGGIIDGIDSGRKITWFLFYGTGEFDSETAARNAPIDLSIFGNSKPKLLTLWRLLLRKNQTNIESFFDLRPFFGQPAGAPAAIQATIDLQGAYDLSPNGGTPEIKTNDIQEDLTIQYEGTNGKILDLWKAENDPVFTAWTSGVLFKENIAILEDRKTSGSSGGGCVASDYIVRDLNTERISASFVNLSSNNQFILQPGTYYIKAEAPAYFIGYHRVNVYNSTDTTYLTDTDSVSNPVTYTGATVNLPGVSAKLYGRFSILSPKVFSFVHRCSTTKSTDGFGTTFNFGETEIFSRVFIRRESL